MRLCEPHRNYAAGGRSDVCSRTDMVHPLLIPDSCRSSDQPASRACGARHMIARPFILSTRPSRYVLIAALLAPLAACKAGPDFTAPTAPLADNWLESGNGSIHTDRQDDEQWWTVFNDATLDHLIDIAYRQNLTLMAGGTRVLEARATLGVAVGEFYPQTQQIGGNVGYNQASQVDPSSNPQHQLENYWRASLNTQIAWELDLWGQFRCGVESADAAYLASIASYDDVLVTLIGDVATTYIGIRTLQQQLVIAHENVVKQRKALQIATDRFFHGGTTTALDVYQAENVLAQTQSMIPQLTAELQQGEDALRVLLGIAPASLDALLAGPETIPVPPRDVAVGIPADLIRRRPDIRSVELQQRPRARRSASPRPICSQPSLSPARSAL
jgi:NodT family efflux transporter outer membrane factor (OMF) lipoprotein